MTPESSHGSATEEVLRRVQGEFLEMPGLRLTEPQARRLWGLDAASCSALLGALVDAKFLSRTRDGAFVRSDTIPSHRQFSEVLNREVIDFSSFDETPRRIDPVAQKTRAIGDSKRRHFRLAIGFIRICCLHRDCIAC